MSDFPESGIKLVADTSDFTDKMEEALNLADEFDAVGDMSVTLDASVDTSQAESDISSITDESATVDIAADVTTDDTSSKILDSLNVLKNLKVLETVWNIAGTAVDIFGKFSDFAITPMLDLDDAVAKVNAQTGNAIPNARELISGIFYDDLGDSIDQVGNMVIAAGQMHVPIDEAVRAALEFTHTFKDQNPQLVLTTLDQMVKNGLAPDIKTAGDNLTVAFQNGANKGGDLLQTINDNAGAIHDLGLTGPQAMEVFTSGMDAGFKSSQDVLNTLIKIKQNVQAAANNPTSDVSKTLNMLGIANPAETGDAWSLDFFQSVIDGIKNAPVSDTDKMAMFSNLLGAKVGAKEFSNLMRLSPEDWANVFSNVDGASAAAAKTVDDSLRGAIDDFSLAASAAMQDFLSSDQIDLPGKIAALKKGLQDGLDVLAKGGTLGEALTIALKPIGFDDEFKTLEGALNNFIIGILQAVSTIQDITGHGTEAAGTRATVANMAKGALTMDLQIGNADTVASDIQTAISRGVKGQDIADAIGDAVTALIKEGAPAQAQALLDTFKTGTFGNTAGMTPGEVMAAGQAPTSFALNPDNAQKMQAQIDAANKLAQESLPPATAAIQDQSDKTNILKTSINDMVLPMNDATAAANKFYDPLSSIAVEAPSAADATVSFADSLALFAQQVQAQANTINAIKINVPVGTAPTVTAADVNSMNPKHAGGTPSAIGTFLAGEHGPELITSNRALAVLNNQTTSAIMSALQGFIPGGGGVTRAGGNSYQLNQTNVVQSMAEADALGYRTAQQIRGMA